MLLPGARRAAKSNQEFLWPDCVVGRKRAPSARGAPETLQEATPRTSLRLARVPRPGSPGHLLPSTWASLEQGLQGRPRPLASGCDCFQGTTTKK